MNRVMIRSEYCGDVADIDLALFTHLDNCVAGADSTNGGVG